MTNWYPTIEESAASKTNAIFESLRADILQGKLRPGQQIPTLRTIANHLGLNAATVKRAFDHAEAEGLIERHVGRGTFVRSEVTGAKSPTRRTDGLLDLATNCPPALEEEILRTTLSEAVLTQSHPSELFRYHAEADYATHLEAISNWISWHGIHEASGNIVVTPGAQAAIATALLTAAKPNTAIAVENLTYPGFTSACNSLGYNLATIESDDEGMCPDALLHALDNNPAIQGIFVIPRVHNPTTRTMSAPRIQAIAAIVESRGLFVIEDDSYISARIDDEHPTFKHLCRDRTYYVSGFSKIVQPGLRTGFVIPPAQRLVTARVAAKSLNYSISPLLLEIVRAWIVDGTARRVYKSNIEFFRRRQEVAAALLRDLDFQADRNNAQLWLQLPEGWSSLDFTETARREDLLFSPAESFQTNRKPGSEKHIRLCLGAILDEADFVHAVTKVAKLCRLQPTLQQYQA